MATHSASVPRLRLSFPSGNLYRQHFISVFYPPVDNVFEQRPRECNGCQNDHGPVRDWSMLSLTGQASQSNFGNSNDDMSNNLHASISDRVIKCLKYFNKILDYYWHIYCLLGSRSSEIAIFVLLPRSWRD